MAPYGRAYAFQAAGQGLRELGALLSQRRREKQALELDERDRELREREARAQELAQPGARSLESAVAEGAEFTPESLSRIGNAADVGDPGMFAFRAPAPRTVEDPLTEETISVQDPAPYLTARGVVMDPGAATRYERGLDAERNAISAGRQLKMDERLYERDRDRTAARRLKEIARLQSGGIPRERAEAIVDPSGEVDSSLLSRELHPEMYRTEWNTPGATRGVPTYNQAMETLQRRYQIVKVDGQGRPYIDTASGYDGYKVPWEDMDAEAREMASGKGMRAAPKPAPAGADLFPAPGLTPDRSPGWSARGGRPAPVTPPGPASDTRTEQQRDWDSLAETFGKDETVRRVGPRPGR